MIQVQAPNGTVVQFPDGTPASTIKAQMSAYHDAVQGAAKAGRFKTPGAETLVNGMMFGHGAQATGAEAAIATAIDNLFPATRHPYGARDAYQANKGVERSLLDAYGQWHPGKSLAGNFVGAGMNPLSWVGGEWVNGAKTLPQAMARASAVSAAEGGAAGGPKGALIGALTGPVIPMLGPVAGHAGAAVGGVARNVQRMAGAAPPSAVATRRLAAAVAKDVKAGADPQAILNNWPGVSAPTLADVGGENVRAVVRDAGTQGPARTSLAEYQRKTAADLQGHALTLTDRLPGPNVPAPLARQTAQQALDDAAAAAPSVQPGSGGAALSAELNNRADVARQAVDAAYETARAAGPEKAHLASAALPDLTAAVRSAISDYSPKDIPRVSGNISDLDSLSTPTARDLFEIRSRLSNLRASNDPVEAGAAGKAVRALDGQIDQADQNNLFTGDPQAVALWKDAIAHRRMYGQMFEGNDLIHALTNQELHGAGRSLAIAPEDASNAILGRSGVAPRANLTRDFGRITDMLGDDHPAVQALQQEAEGRLLSSDAGSPKFGTAIQGFADQNPDLAKVLIRPETLADVAARRGRIAEAAGDQAALDTGGGILNARPEQYAIQASASADRIPMMQVGGKQALSDVIGSRREGALGPLDVISTATNDTRNLAQTFGDDPADTYQRGLQAEADRVRNANYMAPQLGAKTFTSAQDAGHGGMLHIPAMVLNLAKTALGGGPLNDAERQAVVNPAIDQLTPELLTALLKTRKAPLLIPGSGFAVGPLASVSAQAGS